MVNQIFERWMKKIYRAYRTIVKLENKRSKLSKIDRSDKNKDILHYDMV